LENARVKAYLDSSAFAKRFVEEAGSDAVETVCSQASQLGLSILCVPEITSALNRRKRERTLTAVQYAEAKRRLLVDVHDAEIIALAASVVGTAISVLETSPVRAMDALHIASALEWGAELFVSSDKKQLDAAHCAGMKTRQV
jgi:uncharacterized protein